MDQAQTTTAHPKHTPSHARLLPYTHQQHTHRLELLLTLLSSGAGSGLVQNGGQVFTTPPSQPLPTPTAAASASHRQHRQCLYQAISPIISTSTATITSAHDNELDGPQRKATQKDHRIRGCAQRQGRPRSHPSKALPRRERRLLRAGHAQFWAHRSADC